MTYAEARSALARKTREGIFDNEGHRRVVQALDDDWSDYVRQTVTNLVAYRAGKLAERYALRGFDAVHLASALRLRERFEDLSFLAFDDRLNTAARRVLEVYGER